ncbi:hypothetical protein HZC30_07410 [Candidatus Woesearchaeota archaeon]|nr:hypothetical protein [Candidatus Woesearchaeota archaeon]
MENKVYGRLELKVLPNVELNRKDIALYSGAKQVFSGYKLPQEAKVFWPVNPALTKEDHLRNLLFFYEFISGADPKQSYRIERAKGLVLRGENRGKKAEVVLQNWQFTGAGLLSHPVYSDFDLLQVATPYVTFAMDGEGRRWESQTGKISVSASVDLSLRVAKLMGETAKYKLDVEVLEEVLIEIYSFDKEAAEPSVAEETEEDELNEIISPNL